LQQYSQHPFFNNQNYSIKEFQWDNIIAGKKIAIQKKFEKG